MPNLLGKEVLLALSFIFPWNFKNLQSGKAVSTLEKYFETFFGINSVITFDSGRSSLQIALESLELHQNDEVLLQAYTCCVVSNAVTWSGTQPIYVDIDKNFNMDPHDLEKKITPRSKVLIIQHTFGVPADLDALIDIAKKHNLTIIEDCAHVIGGTYKNKMLGTWGDIGMLSFGTDKSISCGRGGALLTNNGDLAEKFRRRQQKLPHLSKKYIIQQLYTFVLFFICKPLYTIGIGKIVFAVSKKLHISSKIIEQSEKKGERDSHFPAKLPDALAVIALHQTKHLKEFNEHRIALAQNYQKNIHNPKIQMPKEIQNIPFLRFPILVKNPKKLHKQAQKEGILLGDWYNSVIAPRDSDQSKMAYVPGSCPNAETLVQESINLPTHIHISPKDQEKIIKIVNSYAE
jgi:dTDP-4-amino-4,6-dideoxygalactose transaminase